MIRLISGVYGAEDGMKRPKDGPFSLTDNEEARLVSRGVAEYVFDRTTLPAAPSRTESANAIRYDEGMTMKQLRGIADYLGLDTSKLRSKRDVVKLLDAHFASAGTGEEPPEEEDEPTEEEGDGEAGEVDPDAPDLGAEEPTV
ncbi:hypothetical protein [uncultured Oscillibacter sp.]|jgi:hypothetical protein|uniref:hypothetical protein n=1 Tax=uncultured Oscillibacter sp. TaxID=876091 RepID=UPI0026372BAE|nr:hypothetical protein [uncultured Oscillibacter sp.]